MITRILCAWWLCVAVFGLMPARGAETAASVPAVKRILILVSLDGFRWDYLEKYQPPHLLKLAKDGTRAEKLIPTFPSMTFPNHHTIATGLWPEHHGILHNGFYDPATKQFFTMASGGTNGAWWGGEPIWVTAVKQGRVADGLLWPGIATTIQGTRATEAVTFSMKISSTECVDRGLAYLDQPAERRPGLLILYFHQTDSVGHKRGPDSSEIRAAITEVDDAMGRLVEGLHQRKLDDVANLVIVSDHGMAEVSTNRMIALPDYVKSDEAQVDFSGAIAGLRPLEGDAASLYAKFAGHENHFKAYRREDLPEAWHFRDNPKIPPVILVADEGWYLSKRAPSQLGHEFEKATHGFDPKSDSMGALFIASGPAFRTNTVIPPVQNVHIYNLLCATLGLKPAPNDGDDRLVKQVLRAEDAK